MLIGARRHDYRPIGGVLLIHLHRHTRMCDAFLVEFERS